ncbi:ADP-ribosylglycohydrolase family protein [Tardisphaera miroshnichenkoae]
MDANTYLDKIRGCWTGKNAGGTLGMPFEGKREVNDVTFYTQQPGEPAPNDDLDLQLMWLKALEENGMGISSETLADYWVNYVAVDWNEYGVAKDNIRRGMHPPLSGKFRNGWQNSNGGWIRSEIWGSVFAGMPCVAAQYGLMDGSIDHGDGEGTYAEAFTAYMDSAAYFESDPKGLIKGALSVLPQQSEVRKAVMAALESYERELPWSQARDNVIAASEETGWFQAPRNLGYVTIGLLRRGGLRKGNEQSGELRG